MKLSALLLIFLLAAIADSVNANKFKKCSQSGFCSRHRDKPTKLKYVADPKTKDVVNNTFFMTLKPSRPQSTNLILRVSFHDHDIARLHIAEENPLHGKARYEAEEVLYPGIVNHKIFRYSSTSPDHVVVESSSGTNKLKVFYDPLLIEWYSGDILRGSMNSKDLFYYEVTRENTDKSQKESMNEPAQENKKKIVEYNESGQAIYEDGTVGDAHEDMNNRKLMEVEVDANGDHVKRASTSPEELEDETGYWSEYFDGHTDSKPYGPQSVGLDITFHKTDALFGLPEHASSLMLQPTTGSKYDEPYRLYNLDVCEYEVDSPMALYGSIPFILAHDVDATVGFLWLNPTDSYFDVHDNVNNTQTVQIMSEAGVIDIFFLTGGYPTALLTQYATLTSYGYFPPFFSLGYHQSRWNYLDEKDLMGVVDKFEELNFPFDVVWLDIEHTEDKKYFTWDKKNFPEPKKMIEAVNKRGHAVVTVVDPHVKKDDSYEVYQEMKEKDLLLKKSNKDTYEGWCWPGNSVYPDFTQEGVRAYWSSRFDLDKYEGTTHGTYTWNDMNEPSVFNGPEVTMPKDVVNKDGIEHRQWHNMYSYFYSQANFEGQLQRSPDQRPFVLTRGFFVGSQRFGPMWTGDNECSWAHLKHTMPMLMSAGLAGMPFTGADIPGFFKNPSDELAVRWYQLGAWTPFMRAHAHIDTKRREPWTFGTETFDRIRNAVVQRYQFLPYTYTFMFFSSMYGSPLIHPLWYLFSSDVELLTEERSFMFGDYLIVAPVVNEGDTTVTTRLPVGKWYNIQERRILDGGQEVTLQAPLDYIPILQKVGSVIPMQMRLRRSAKVMMNDPYTLSMVYDENGYAEGFLYHDERDGYGFRNRRFVLMKYQMRENTMLSQLVEGIAYEECKNKIEAINIITTREPKRLVAKDEMSEKEWDLDFTYDVTKDLLVIKNTGLGACDFWEIDMQY